VPIRGPLTIAALLVMALVLGTLVLGTLVLGSCVPSGLSDAERVWCDDHPVTVIAAADTLNIGPEPKGSLDSPDTLAQWSYRRASCDPDWVRACLAAYESR